MTDSGRIYNSGWEMGREQGLKESAEKWERIYKISHKAPIHSLLDAKQLLRQIARIAKDSK